jgi:ParB family chromosome partitioning protein
VTNPTKPPQNKDRRLGRGLAALLGTPLDDDGNPLPESNGGSGSMRNSGGTSGSSRPVPSDSKASQSTSAQPTSSQSKPSASAGNVKAGSTDQAGEHDGSRPSERQAMELNVYEIDNNPFQPRREFNASEIASLAESLKEHQQLQPVLVRRVGDRYQLISGERRLRAAIHAGMSTVRAEVREADDRLVAELAIIENLQRKDLNAIEKAMSFRRYIEQHGCTQDELGQRLKIDRSTIANMMRLLELPEKILSWIQDEVLSAGHGRALLSLGDEAQQIRVGKQMIDEGWSVRAAEQNVAEMLRSEDAVGSGKSGPAVAGGKRSVTPQIESLQQELRHQLGTKVEIRQTSRGKGKITIHFANADEFERLRAMMSTQSTPQLKIA